MAVSGAAGSQAFEEWYRREHPRVVGALMWVAGDVDAAKEAADEAFTRALERWERVSVMDAPGGWVQRVAMNALKRSRRRAAAERRLFGRHGTSVASVEGPAIEAWDMLRSLPLRERQAVALRYVADLTEVQIAEAMGVRRSTVSVLLRRAQTKLAARFEEAEGEW